MKEYNLFLSLTEVLKMCKVPITPFGAIPIPGWIQVPISGSVCESRAGFNFQYPVVYVNLETP